MSQRLHILLEPIVTDLGYELWHIESGTGWMRVYIDGPAGIDLEDCEAVSREIGATLAVEGLSYDLEVSSPGIERPLATAQHFSRFAGERARLKLYAPIEGQRRIAGVIKPLDEQTVEISSPEAAYSVPLANIAKATLDPILEDSQS